MNGDEEIANLLYNNMFPVQLTSIAKVIIDPLVDTYCANEIRYIRKNWKEIEEKAKKVYDESYDIKSRNYSFLKKTCCDFKKLEKEYKKYTIEPVQG